MQKKYAYIASQFLDIALYLSQLTGLLRTILSIVLTELRWESPKEGYGYLCLRHSFG